MAKHVKTGDTLAVKIINTSRMDPAPTSSLETKDITGFGPRGLYTLIYKRSCKRRREGIFVQIFAQLAS